MRATDTAPLPAPPTIPPQKDAMYFLAPLITLEVEGTLFRIPREYLELSNDFSSHYLPEAGTDGLLDAFNPSALSARSKNRVSNDTSAGDYVKLEDVSAADFRAFLDILFPHPSRGDNFILGLTEDSFERALSLATRWGFEAIRATCIAGLDRVVEDPARRIQIAHHYQIPQWIGLEVKKLAERANSLTVKEMLQIGTETVAQIAYYRDLRFDHLKELASLNPLVTDLVEEAQAQTLATVLGDILDRQSDDEISGNANMTLDAERNKASLRWRALVDARECDEMELYRPPGTEMPPSPPPHFYSESPSPPLSPPPIAQVFLRLAEVLQN